MKITKTLTLSQVQNNSLSPSYLTYIFSMDSQSHKASAAELEKQTYEQVIHTMVKNLENIKRQAREHGHDFDPKIFEMPPTPPKKNEIPNMRRVGRSSHLLSTESLPHIIDSNVDRGKLGVYEEKNEGMTNRERRIARKTARKKAKRDKLQKEEDSNAWRGGIPMTLETLRQKDQKGVLTSDDFF